MIHFKPCEASDKSDELYFEAIENDVVCGKCRLVLRDKKATIDFLTFDEDKPYLVEGLIKSAFNYAALQNCYMGYCECENITFFLDRMNLIKKDNFYYNDIPTILQGNCCKNKHKV